VAIADEAPSVQTLSIDVYLANWDADVESDGIVVTLAALDFFGQAVPVNGSLDVELIAEQLPPYTRDRSFPAIGRWTLSLTPDDANAAGYYRVRLPFQWAHPEYDLTLPRYALAHVRLVVPGRGTFEASVDAVALRGFSPVRERLQASGGGRLLPTEQSGRGKQESSRDIR
jgi:hypothetical protein